MHSEVLDEKRKKIFPLLRHFENFYLAGGTALALQIGHRISIDFDLFIQKEIPRSLFTKVKRVFSGFVVKPIVNNSDELTVLADDVKVTFFNSHFPPVLKLLKYGEVRMLSAAEVAVDKAYTIGRRGKYRDYMDLFFILSHKISSLDTIIRLADKKYGAEFNSRLFLEQLIYLEDIKDDPILFLKKKVSKSHIEKFLKDAVRRFKL